METDRQANLASSVPLLAIITALIGMIYVYRAPPKSSRPQTPWTMKPFITEKDKVSAKLWQDPFQVTLEHEKVMHWEGVPNDSDPRWGCVSSHEVNQVSRRIFSILRNYAPVPRTSVVNVLLIMARDGPFAEDYERRLRSRYAVLTALSASGFSPEDTKNIQYFRVLWTDEDQLENSIKHDDIPRISTVTDLKSRTIIVPFEWFKRDELYTITNANSPTGKNIQNVLCVWLPESAFSHWPLTRLAQIIEALEHTHRDKVKIDVIGPSYSDTLLAMLKEIVEFRENEVQQKKHGFDYVKSRLFGLTIFSPWSTASPALLMREADVNAPDSYGSPSEMYGIFAEKFKPLGINFLRMTGSDDLLAMELIRELRRRGVDLTRSNNRVALISELDTLYGQAFPLTFTTLTESMKGGALGLFDLDSNWLKYTRRLSERNTSSDDDFPKSVVTYRYIRGIDGILPEFEAIEAKPADNGREAQAAWTYTKNLELPIGRGQSDYVSRLVQRLRDENKGMFNNKLRAIGVVGSDVYDKLYLLSVLRERFPNVIFFTVDLDARMMHQDQLKWTRNLIVASNYGLELNGHYQVGAYQPFRDNYQTALFFTCKAALGLPIYESDILFRNMCQEQLTEFLEHPRLFEIGKRGAVDLSVDNAAIHPVVHQYLWKNSIYTILLIFSGITFCILLVAQVSPSVYKIVFVTKSRHWNKGRSEVGLLTTTVILFAVIVFFDHYRLGGEPFSLSGGISLWPGEALHLIATIISIYFLAKSFRDLRENEIELGRHFQLETPRISEIVTFAKWRKHRKRIQVLSNPIKDFLAYSRFISINAWSVKEQWVDANRLWKAYLARSTISRRIHRVIPMCCLFLAFSTTLMYIFGPPNSPGRGNISFVVHRILLLASVSAMIILLFFVVDATCLSLQLLRNLIRANTYWPLSMISSPKIKNKDCDISTDITDWLDIKFIALHTEAVGKLIYYPFIIIVIFFIARTHYFDNWNFPVSLTVMVLLCLVYLFGCAIVLRRFAEQARQAALDRLRTKLVVTTGRAEEIVRYTRLKHMIEEIESLRQGAFRPFREHPAFHVLFGSGGAGLLALLKLFLPS